MNDAMGFQISLAIVIISLTLNPKTLLSEAKKPANVSKGSETKLSGWIHTASVGIQLFEQKCFDVGSCHRFAYFRAKLSCKLHNTPLAVMIINRRPAQRSAFVRVLNKDAWQGCPTMDCSVTHVCPSLNERDCKLLKKKNSNILTKQNMIRSVFKPQNRVTMRQITYITPSSRYSNIVYGHGSTIEDIDRIISINTTIDGVVREHSLGDKRRRKMIVAVCGFTTGLCNASSMYICYYAISHGGNHRLRIFEEPDIDRDKLENKKHFADLAERSFSVVSIAIDENCVMYAMGVNDGKTTIRVFHIRNIRQVIFLKVIKELFIFCSAPLSLDIRKKGHQLLIVNERSIHVLSPDNLSDQTDVNYRTMGKNRIHFEGMNLGNLVCWSTSGRHVLFIEKEFPYKFKKYKLK